MERKLEAETAQRRSKERAEEENDQKHLALIKAAEPLIEDICALATSRAKDAAKSGEMSVFVNLGVNRGGGYLDRDPALRHLGPIKDEVMAAAARLAVDRLRPKFSLVEVYIDLDHVPGEPHFGGNISISIRF